MLARCDVSLQKSCPTYNSLRRIIFWKLAATLFIKPQRHCSAENDLRRYRMAVQSTLNDVRNVCIWSVCRLMASFGSLTFTGLETSKLMCVKTAQWSCCYVNRYRLPFSPLLNRLSSPSKKRDESPVDFILTMMTENLQRSQTLKLKIDWSTTLAHYWGKLLLKIHSCT